jgi:hypothetical protein
MFSHHGEERPRVIVKRALLLVFLTVGMAGMSLPAQACPTGYEKCGNLCCPK